MDVTSMKNMFPKSLQNLRISVGAKFKKFCTELNEAIQEMDIKKLTISTQVTQIDLFDLNFKKLEYIKLEFLLKNERAARNISIKLDDIPSTMKRNNFLTVGANGAVENEIKLKVLKVTEAMKSCGLIDQVRVVEGDKKKKKRRL